MQSCAGGGHVIDQHHVLAFESACFDQRESPPQIFHTLGRRKVGLGFCRTNARERFNDWLVASLAELPRDHFCLVEAARDVAGEEKWDGHDRIRLGHHRFHALLIQQSIGEKFSQIPGTVILHLLDQLLDRIVVNSQAQQLLKVRNAVAFAVGAGGVWFFDGLGALLACRRGFKGRQLDPAGLAKRHITITGRLANRAGAREAKIEHLICKAAEMHGEIVSAARSVETFFVPARPACGGMTAE